jgi:ribosomal protein S12 methylthiotransferase
MMRTTRPIRVNFVSLGCAKNLLDSEKMLALLGEAGVALVAPDDEADVTIINTCSFIDEARQEAFEAIDEALEGKRSGLTNHVIVAGCLAQHWAGKLKKQFPDIDAVVGLTGRGEIAHLVHQITGRIPSTDKVSGDGVLVEPFRGEVLEDRGRLRLTERCWTYLRISEGCSQGCSFCTIPRIRGPYRSKTPDEILAEAAELVADGALELNLIGQETSSYGSDIGYSGGLARLLRQLNEQENLRWIRLLYVHPVTLSDEQIVAIASCEKIVPYIDIPLQHISDRILQMMNRHITRQQTEELLNKLRRGIDNLALRTTMLVGFPTETDVEFEELLDFMRQNRFEALGAFKYSAEAGTKASHIKGAIPPDVQQQRWDKLMQVQQEIAFEQADALAGQELDCLLLNEMSEPEIKDLQLPRHQRWFNARHARQAPEIDSVCFLAAPNDNKVTENIIMPAVITGRCDYDLIGEIIINP